MTATCFTVVGVLNKLLTVVGMLLSNPYNPNPDPDPNPKQP